MNRTAWSWLAFHETLGHFAYWVIILAVLFGGIAYFTRRDAIRQRRKK